MRGALEAIWRYNWAPDVSTQGDVHKPMRYLAEPGESGLINCTWPKSKHMGDNAVRYKNEVWTGIEYQVASHMLYEGMVEEGLAIVRSIHDRYDGVKHNPWNEIECGDHYARALASWGCLLGISGFSYDGPAGRIGFSPKLTPEDFRAFFSGAEGWGSYAQARGKDFQTGTIDVNWGALALRTIDLELPQNQPDARLSVSVSGRPVGAKLRLAGASATVVLNDEAVLKADESLDIKLEW